MSTEVTRAPAPTAEQRPAGLPQGDPGLLAEISLSAIAHNTEILARRAGAGGIMAVVKGDGYGHGAAEVARTALAYGASEIGVATLEEALALRAAGIEAPILSWLWTMGAPLAEALRAGVGLGIVTPWHLDAVLAAAAATGCRASVTVKIDTGLGRSGVTAQEWPDLLDRLVAAERDGHLRVRGLMAHFATADAAPGDAAGERLVDAQIERLGVAIEEARTAGLDPSVNHHANSAALLRRGSCGFELARPGIALYGLNPVPDVPGCGPEDLDLWPALTWSAAVLAVKTLPAGQGVSYGHTWMAPQQTTVAVIPAGYADGVRRALSGRFSVSINGHRYPQVGRVCMDQFVIDLGENPHGVRPGDRAVLVGDGRDGGPTAAEWAELLDTIHYEVVTSVSGRTVRRVLPLHDDSTATMGHRDLPTVDDTRALGEELAAALRAGDVVILDGPLGAGKTALTSGLARGLGVRGRVTSPTFTLAHEHRAGRPEGLRLVHVDAYRLLGDSPEDGYSPAGVALLDELEALDLDAELDLSTSAEGRSEGRSGGRPRPGTVLVVEWGAGIAERLGARALTVTLERAADSDVRRATWAWTS